MANAYLVTVLLLAGSLALAKQHHYHAHQVTISMEMLVFYVVLLRLLGLTAAIIALLLYANLVTIFLVLIV